MLCASFVALLGVLFLGADAAPAGSLLSAMTSGFGLGDVLVLMGSVCWSMQLFRLARLAKAKLPAVQLQGAKTALMCFMYFGWMATDVVSGYARLNNKLD